MWTAIIFVKKVNKTKANIIQLKYSALSGTGYLCRIAPRLLNCYSILNIYKILKAARFVKCLQAKN